ncbi:MAG: penicillin acylase family protein [Flavobacteriaceae bacterium]|nr:penicillin acylase family protein [Flavobacteriaceae bacterium]|tara:strand:- start:39993 stop:42374 length:2382 start_codon:yes stop_codon:yes gene_type:complete
MKLIKKLFKFIVVLVILLFVAGWFYTNSLKPTYDGNLEIQGLSAEVDVYFDKNGVPHINAQNQEDAYRALGYVHAQDRLWQMELIRRIAPGRLSEVFGADLIKTDKMFSGLGIEEASIRAIEKLDTSSKGYKMTQAYLAGVNQFIDNGPTPIEYTLVGLEKENYTIKDVYNVFGYMAFSFAVAHKTDPLMTEINEKLGSAYVAELIDTFGKNLTINKSNNKEISASMAVAVNDIMDNMPISPFIGSNSWVIAPEKTKNGKVILANDPHISFAQPSVWYQNHITTPDYEIYGFNLALMPFPLLGHNRDYAYGLTMLANDDLNFYTQENNPENPNQYKTPDGYQDYEILDKTIKVKDGEDVSYQVKVSRHGPIMNDLIDQIKYEKPVAMYWLYTQLNNELMDVSYGMAHAKSIEEFKNTVAKIHAPGLNVMYGDAKGNVGWFASARLYQLRDSLSTKMYLDGASGKDDVQEFLGFEENPKAINPKWNYVYSANNQMDSVRGKLYPGYYQPQDRAKRIVTLLDAKNDFTKEDVAKMIYDVTSATTPEIAKYLIASVDATNLKPSGKKALDVLSKWDGSYTKESIAPTIYNRFLYEFLARTYKDELGDSFSLFINTQLQDQVLSEQVRRENSLWWDDVTTSSKKETKNEIVQASFEGAIAFLSDQLGDNVDNWMWKRVLSIEHGHAIGKAGGLLRKIFNVGPFETVGGNEVLNNHIFNLDSTGYYKVTAGPSTRRVIDFSDIENSISVLPTGQSGNVFSPHYKDQAQKYLDGKFIRMLMDQAEIKESENLLKLSPKN